VTVAGNEVQGLLDNDYEPVQFGNQVVESNVPILLVRTSDTTGIAHGDTVVVSGTSYTIREIRVDGEGMTEIVMSET
jgi:hypothetical protein